MAVSTCSSRKASLQHLLACHCDVARRYHGLESKDESAVVGESRVGKKDCCVRGSVCLHHRQDRTNHLTVSEEM